MKAKHTEGKVRADIENGIIWATSIGGCSLEKAEFMLAQIRGWGHLQYLENGADIQDANLKHLVECWNNHYELLEALKNLVNCLDNIHGFPRLAGKTETLAQLQNAKQVIAKVEESNPNPDLKEAKK